MIVLFTDFGFDGPYLGQVRAVLLCQAPGVPSINLFADAPAFNARAAAYLLAAYIDEFPTSSVFLCVVDPGVGSARRPLIMRADNYWFVGPDNGLLEIVARRASQVQWWEITYSPPRLSASFHGRDLFAPVAAQLAMGMPVPGSPICNNRPHEESWPNDLYEIVYIDRYGNSMTGVRASMLDRHTRLFVKGQIVSYARTFSEMQAGEPFWYENANGLVEIALKEASAAKKLSLAIGDTITRAMTVRS
jgi:S-adenosylmethionine hydrolase